jgi:hypothetical protein
MPTPILSAEDGLLFEAVEAAPGSPLDPAALQSAYQNLIDQREVFLDSPQAAAERAASVDAYENLGPAAAILLLKSTIYDSSEGRVTVFTPIRRIEDYLDMVIVTANSDL